MNIKRKILVSFFTVLVTVFVVITYSIFTLSNKNDARGVNWFLSSEVKIAYCRNEHFTDAFTLKKLRETYISQYCGEFSGYDIFVVRRTYDEDEAISLYKKASVYLDGILITESYNNGHLIAYKNGEVILVTAAYERGLLSYDDIKLLSKLTD